MTKWKGDADGSEDVTEDIVVDVPPGCGNGTWEAGEECDGEDLAGETCESLGFSGGTLGCTDVCTFDTSGCSECGNGDIEPGEQCEGEDLRGRTCEDLGYEGGTLACGSDCLFNVSGCEGEGFCGNGVKDESEECDGVDLDGQTCEGLDFDGGVLGCTGECTYDTSGCTDCGNGAVESGEQCDGTDLGGATCEGLGFDGGTLGCTGECTHDTSGCTTCGDGTLETGEECDGTELGGATCSSRGFVGGTLGCTSSCTFDTSGCHDCGNGSIDAGEECDGSDLGGSTCSTFGFHDGSLGCTSSCTYDTSGCHDCGNGSIDTGEECDGTDLGGATCESLGHTGGTLACSGTCTFDRSGCDNCGNGSIDSGEDCDGSALGGETCTGLGFDGGTLGCTGACAFDTSGCTTCGDGTLDTGEECDDGNSVNWDGCSDTCAITEFRVNTYTTRTQSNAYVSMLSDGRFVVTWQSDRQDGSYYGIYAQRYTTIGAPAGAEFRVNTYTTEDQTNPGVSMAPDGSFVIVWNSWEQDGNRDGVYCQRFGPTGTPVGTEFQVNVYTTHDQYQPEVAVASDGSFVVVWSSYGQDGDDYGIYARRYDSTGSAVGSEFRVNTYTTSWQVSPKIAMAADNSFVVTWHGEGSADTAGIFAQRYDSTATAVGSQFLVNTYTTSYQWYPSLGMVPDGRFVVAWESDGQDGSGYGVYAQRYDSTGSPAGAELRANSTTASDQDYAGVAADSTGRFVVTWASDGQDGSGTALISRPFNASGTALGSESVVNVFTSDDQYDPVIAMANDGRHVIAYTSWTQDGAEGGIYAQRFDASGNPLGALPW